MTPPENFDDYLFLNSFLLGLFSVFRRTRSPFVLLRRQTLCATKRSQAATKIRKILRGVEEVVALNVTEEIPSTHFLP